MNLVNQKKIGSRVAKDLLPDLFNPDGKTPSELAAEKGLLQVSDTASLQPVVDEILAENTAVVEEYKKGKEASMQFLLGQGMRKTRGSADPQILKELIDKAIKN
jgi:aspartyl-tRNA(Asn)/glutamyl-tRNA(Gln) amidotransferase subunit B